MMDDPFATSTFSLVFSWIAFLGFISTPFYGIAVIYVEGKEKGAHWLFSTWVLLCLLVFSPFVYLVFQVAMVVSFPFQSVPAFIASMALALYVPIILVILFVIGVFLPWRVSYWLLANKRPIKWPRYLLASVGAPVAAILGLIVFQFLVPIAAISVHWLRPDEVIRATNGPAHCVFGLCSPIQAAAPSYFHWTPQTTQDYLRCHVAYLYLSDRHQEYFVEKAYPEIHEAWPHLPQSHLTAIEDCLQGIQLNPTSARAYCMRGTAYGWKGDWDSAIADFTEASRLDPKLGEAYYRRGVAYRVTGDEYKAKLDFDSAERLGFKPQ